MKIDLGPWKAIAVSTLVLAQSACGPVDTKTTGRAETTKSIPSSSAPSPTIPSSSAPSPTTRSSNKGLGDIVSPVTAPTIAENESDEVAHQLNEFMLSIRDGKTSVRLDDPRPPGPDFGRCEGFGTELTTVNRCDWVELTYDKTIRVETPLARVELSASAMNLLDGAEPSEPELHQVGFPEFSVSDDSACVLASIQLDDLAGTTMNTYACGMPLSRALRVTVDDGVVTKSGEPFG